MPVAGVLTWPLGNQRPQAQGSAWYRVVANSVSQINATATISDAGGETRSASQTTTVSGPPETVFRNGFEGL